MNLVNNNILSERVLVIDKMYQPIMFISVRRAICLIFTEKAELLTTDISKYINSTSQKFPKPTVIKVITEFDSFDLQISLNRWSIYARDNFTCAYCNVFFHNKKLLSIDHINPVSKGGKDTWENLITSCLTCNQKKADRTIEESKIKMYFKAYKPVWTTEFMLRLSQISHIDPAWKTYLSQEEWHNNYNKKNKENRC